MIARCGILSGVATVVLWATLAAAQPQAPQGRSPETGTVSGSGMVLLKRKPDLLRLKVDVIAQGKTMKEALASLKDRREATQVSLGKLGAVKESVAFTDPQINSTVLAARQQMAMMIQARMGGGRAKKTAKKAAPPVVVSSRLTAEWPLKGKDTESLLLEISQLQETIKAADLAGKKDLEKLGGEDEELSQELEGMAEGPYGGDPSQGQPGTAAFTLVSKLTPQDRAGALADAFKKAKTQASEIAEAAGTKLGPLRQLGSLAQQGGEADSTSAQWQAYYQAMGGGRGAMPGTESETDSEAQGTQPGEVTYRVTVTASFDIKEKP
jgi:uncharacterized protein YggE